MLTPFVLDGRSLGVVAIISKYLTINITYRIWKEVVSKAKILRDFAGFRRIIWALTTIKSLLPMCVTR